ncbi:MAG TPA: hypothetical protein VML56_03280 [Burkholderiales bacterium]|nr:hypothetical protein [Burkholderiales bacterium]
MFGSGAIDVAIGLAFVFALLSLICSSVTELISQLLGWRAQTLEQGIRNLITDPATREAFYRHPLIRSLGNPTKSGEKGHPSYLPSDMFALVLLDVLAPSQTDQKAPAKDQAAADELRRALQALAGTAGTNLDALRGKVEGWFDDVMDRASGWYKRKAQWMLLVIAVVVTVIANADAISLATSLWQSPSLRASVVEAASAYANEQAANGEEATLDELRQHLDELANRGLPLGWGADKVLSTREAGPWASKLAGLLLTALAASLGAPFWFDLVNKLINVRSTGNVPPRSNATASPADEASR